MNHAPLSHSICSVSVCNVRKPEVGGVYITSMFLVVGISRLIQIPTHQRVGTLFHKTASIVWLLIIMVLY